MISNIKSAGLLGIQAYLVSVEVDIRYSQLPKWSTVGLPESTVKESKDRVLAAVRNSGYKYEFHRVTINLAPADTKKDGTAYDLPIALGLMASSNNLSSDKLEDSLMLGELSLSGELRPIRGVLPVAVMAKELGIKRIIVPKINAKEAVMVEGIDIYGFENLQQVVEFLTNEKPYQPEVPFPYEKYARQQQENSHDLSEIYGQYQAKRALEIAASGGHNILLSGPPGSGKTMLASRIPSILPPLTFEEALETSKVYSVLGLAKRQDRLVTERPFRNPHHSISNAGLIGGGSIPRPGEVSMAHNGVLFLDELPEFQKNVLELLRQPLESHEVTISRATASLVYPARFILVASCNPCPCGYSGHPKIACQCSHQQVQNYRARLSGPLLDRIDLHIEVPPLPYDDFKKRRQTQEGSQIIAQRVYEARQIQGERLKPYGLITNSQMTSRLLEKFCELDDNSERVLKVAMDKYNLSARSMGRILRVSRTLADMSKSPQIQMDHILEAIQYRCQEGRNN